MAISLFLLTMMVLFFSSCPSSPILTSSISLVGTGYIVYSWNYTMHLEQLTSDFIYSTKNVAADFSEYFVEAPVMFKRNNTYYVLFGYDPLSYLFCNTYLWCT